MALIQCINQYMPKDITNIILDYHYAYYKSYYNDCMFEYNDMFYKYHSDNEYSTSDITTDTDESGSGFTSDNDISDIYGSDRDFNDEKNDMNNMKQLNVSPSLVKHCTWYPIGSRPLIRRLYSHSPITNPFKLNH